MTETAQPPVFNRALYAGRFKAMREEALLDDPDLAAIRNTALQAEHAGIAVEPPPERPPVTKQSTRDEQAVDRVARAATDDVGYRVQLIDMAARNGGIYFRLLDALDALEVETLGRWEALIRRVLDIRQLKLTREHTGGRKAARLLPD